MIISVVNFDVARRYRESWISITREFTAVTRAEPGNLWFEWSRSVANSSEYLLIEAFRDEQAGAEHVQSPHFKAGLEAMRPALSATPQIVHGVIDAQGWSPMAELQID
ncbi:putative quinol monooxygenase [Mycobacterium paraintracellulare]|uniref:putative quinol monooxygenase n=1 Tax=Mycobacterium paraintracellulare TaxID=1138383 RepID=UPI0019291545|nr:putative quinol monooxygenase [Mycobacterium paraintracellulare]BCP14065.1 antibiotic biosynthesis monooxygenase [Mycobacterium paraintracellulare]